MKRVKRSNQILSKLIFLSAIVLTGLIFTLILYSCNESSVPEKDYTKESQSINKVVIDPLSLRWTFGNHEPVSMYRRAGKKVTGGAEGSALWLKDWHSWYDSEESAKIMKDLGMNILHSRFYKGMGWQFESKDFPNVKRFVDNCHKHDIRVLAYIQFSSLYYETMLEEVPDLEDWAALDENGTKRSWNTLYYRWIPCINNPDFEQYLKKVIGIALNEGDFDGIMIDNAHVPACYCPRCTELFRDYLMQESDPVDRFGISGVEHVLPPFRKQSYGEIQDPICQEWIKFRCKRATELYNRLYEYAKDCNPEAIVSANIQNIRRANMTDVSALHSGDLTGCFDIFVSQSGNAPGMEDGCIINRVREFKLADALNIPILALCDDDAGLEEEKYVLTLMEDAIYGGIPTNRTVMKPDKENMVSPEHLKFHRSLLKRFNETVETGHDGLSASTYQPIRILYSWESIMFSEQSYRSVLSAEEILLRNHVPYGLLPVYATEDFTIPNDCELLLVCDQRCLSEFAIKSLIKFAGDGGRIIVTGNSGEHDEMYRQRPDNPLLIGLKDYPNAVIKGKGYEVPIKSTGWTIKVAAPEDGGNLLVQDINKMWMPEIKINAQPTVFAEIKQNGDAFYIHFLNYSGEPVLKGTVVEFSGKITDQQKIVFSTPMENRPDTDVDVREVASGKYEINLPSFETYGMLTIIK